MNGSRHLSLDTLTKWMKWCTIAIIIVLIALFVYFRDQLTLRFIVNTISSHPSVSALVLLALYIVKSLSLFFPVVLLYMSSGLIFTPAEAIGLNILGIWLASTITYYIGRFFGASQVNKIYLRYPKVKRLINLQNKNEFFYTFVLRISGIVPMELGAIILGALGPAYRPYIFGSLLGLLPSMLAFTLLGYMISDPTSPGFAITLTASILTSFGAALFYHFRLKKQNEVQSPPVDATLPGPSSKQ